MPLLNFGQPAHGIMQTAYIVKDIRASIAQWVEKLHVGPWFLLEDFKGIDPVYRGKKSEASIDLAMSFSGSMNIELIQPRDNHPSVYKELADTKGYGFHHWGVATPDFNADIKRYTGMGMDVAFRLGVPTGGEVAYLDTNGALPGFLELIQTGPEMERAFSAFYGAALSWDGKTDPIRKFG